MVIFGIMEVTPAHEPARRLGPGDIVRISDVTGTGHATSFIEDCVFAVMAIAG